MKISPQLKKLHFVLAPLLWILIGVGLGLLIQPGGSTSRSTHAEHEEHGAQSWTCSMHPQIQAPESGQCPICGMDLIPADGTGDGEALADDELRLSARAVRLAQIRTTPVEPISLSGSTRALLGRVVPDEARLRAVTAWIGGRIDLLKVSTTGEAVRRGQRLATLYSPEIYAAHQALLAAQAQLKELQGATPYALKAAQVQLEAAQQRLRLLGVSEANLKRMLKAKKPWTQISIRSTAAGTVLERHVHQGDYVKTGQVLYQIADLDQVWINLDAYESDLSVARLNQQVVIKLEALPEQAFQGLITFIDPIVDPKTRTARLRVEVENREGLLKPGMYAHALLTQAQDTDAPVLAIPHTAPLFAGRRALVYIEKGKEGEERRYQAKDVVLGARVGEFFPVLAGLKRGDEVVTHGAFALDADLQIRGGLSLMARPDDRSSSALDEVLALEEAALKQLAPTVTGYLDVQERLADSLLPAAIERARAWRAAVEETKLNLLAPAASLAWSGLRRQLISDLDRLLVATELAEARVIFGHLTRDMDQLLLKFGNPVKTPLRLAFCPMAFENKGGFWYQRASKVNNVYYGDEMRECGELRATVEPAAHLLPSEREK